jgi:hypothetical protein
MKFIQSLSESQLISSMSAYRRFSGRQIADLAYLHIVALRILATEPLAKDFAADYATRSVRYMGFAKWYQSATDLHLLLHALLNEDVDLKLPDTSNELRASLYFDENAIRMWAKDIARGRINEARTKKMFLHLDGDFQVKDSSMKAIRRLVQDWSHVTVMQKKLSMTRLLQMLRVRARRSDLLIRLEKLAHAMDLELRNVNNKETGDVAHDDGKDPEFVKHQKPSMLRSLAAFAGGAVLGYTAVSKLSEGKVIHNEDGCVIVENPTVQQFHTMKQKANHAEGLRAILNDGKLYMWDGYYKTHDEVCQTLGVCDGIDLHLWNGYVECDISEMFEMGDPDDRENAKAIISNIETAITGNNNLRRIYDGVPPIQLDDGEKAGWSEDYMSKLNEDAAAGVTASADIAPLVKVMGPVQRRNRKKTKKKK